MAILRFSVLSWMRSGPHTQRLNIVANTNEECSICREARVRGGVGADSSDAARREEEGAGSEGGGFGDGFGAVFLLGDLKGGSEEE